MTKPKQHKCPHCGRVFRTAQGLGLHFRHVRSEQHKPAGALWSIVDEFFPRALIGPACGEQCVRIYAEQCVGIDAVLKKAGAK